MGRLFGGIRAPSTLGTFLRAFPFGHVRQLDKVAAGVLANLAGHTPLLGDADQLSLVDVDDTVKPTYGYAKQGAGYGYSKVKGLNALLGHDVDADVGAGDRGDPAAEGLDQLGPGRGAAGRRRARDRETVRRDRSGRGPRRLGVLHRRRGRRHRPRPGPGSPSPPGWTAAVRAAIAGSPRPRGSRSTTRTRSVDEDSRWLISDAEVAETSYTAFTSRRPPAGHRPADRAPGPAASTPPPRSRSGRAGRGLPPPRRVHRHRR